MNKQQFRAAYREARKADRFYGHVRKTRGVKVTSMFGTFDLCPGYESCRLHPDRLHTYVGHMGQVTHRSRMSELTLRPRLP